MLVVLSELNILNKLNNLGVFPDDFYTDPSQFKNQMIYFNNATVVIIFMGNCRFNVKNIISLIKSLQNREQNETDRGIKEVIVISDITLPSIKKYYKYTNDIKDAVLMSSWTKQQTNTNIIEKLQTDKKDTRLFLSNLDKGYTEDLYIAEQIDKNHEDKYISLIKIATIE